MRTGVSTTLIGEPSRVCSSLGWVLFTTAPEFCAVDLNLYGYIRGTVIAQRFGFANMKSHAHLNCSTRLDQNPQPKEEQTREGYPMS